MKLDPKKVAKAIGIPLEKWPGNCFGVASAMVNKGVVKGAAVYGHWVGDIDARSMFADRIAVGLCRHGWVEMKDGTVVDATRWVFEHAEPYIFVGKKTGRDWPYDEGGNALRMALQRPAPDFDVNEKTFRLEKRLSSEADAHVHGLFGKAKRRRGILTRMQCHWLAILAYDAYGPWVAEIYGALVAEGLSALIPLDNLRRCEREHGPIRRQREK